MASWKYKNNISEVRKKRGLTQQQVGQAFKKKMDLTVISRWERGVVRPSANNLLELASILRINPAKLTFHNDRQDSQE
ncbi:hypothetical protein BSK66_25955 [Paenibacillus odorifer]|uniref:HTH cro/C1-type domain-containing protein n=1 Tax=Paenibacillus odorifer TaxID=189426 RepID=A0A1R0X1F7_9BACL|nr:MULTISPECIES: helix-turn-helix transcriptional regulator [Paenibacillus]ETT61870.1 hypothetical protein C171_11511 [Paenibacillus sp. FSL H8-237]OMD26545.1 hypothetical protein BJP51_26810 [Paenibacillus odorifer]OME49964.1 hypothetical protein BSK66_25955 [Paenibacillus odorifer]